MMRKLFAVAVLAMVIACIPPEKQKVNMYGGVVKGPVTGAIVTFFALNKDGSPGSNLGSTSTDTHGWYTFTMNEEWSSPILAEASDGNYTDEVTGALVDMTAAEKMTAVVPVGNYIEYSYRFSRVNISPLTHFAAVRARALAKAGVPLASAVDSSNAGVGSQFAVSNIVGTLPPAADNAETVAISTRDERIYALVLAGLAQEANQIGVRAIDLTQALASDASDGKFDGKNDGTAIAIPTIAGTSITLPATAGTTDIQTAIDAFIASSRNKTSIAELKLPLTPLQLGINTTFNGWLYSTTTVMPARLSGTGYTYMLGAKGGKEPYSCSLKAGSSLPTGFTLSNACVITGEAVTVTETTVSAPFIVTLTDSSSPTNVIELPPLRITTVRGGPTITPIAASVVEGVSSSVQVATAAGGQSPYTFMPKSMAPPPLGMVIYSDGVLRGTPKESGSHPFGICVVDIGGMQACTTVMLTIVKGSKTPATCKYTKDDCCPVMSGIKVVACPIDNGFFNDCLKGVCPAGTTLSTVQGNTGATLCECP